jgi:hypothetical protein
MGTGGFLRGGYSDWLMELTTYLHLVLRSRIVEKYLHSPTLHGVVLNELITGASLLYLFFLPRCSHTWELAPTFGA